MEKLAVGLKISPETLSQFVKVHSKISRGIEGKNECLLNAEEAQFIKDIFGEIIQISVAKAEKLESIGNDFLNYFALAKKEG